MTLTSRDGSDAASFEMGQSRARYSIRSFVWDLYLSLRSAPPGATGREDIADHADDGARRRFYEELLACVVFVFAIAVGVCTWLGDI